MGNICRNLNISNLLFQFITVIIFINFKLISSEYLYGTTLPPSYRLDVTKMNVSQEEYTKMINVYLRRVQNQSSYQTKQFLTFSHSGEDVSRHHSRYSLTFKTNLSEPEVESATLRMIIDAVIATRRTHSNQQYNKDNENISINVYERLNDGKRLLIANKNININLLPKWTDIDVERSTLNGELKFEIECNSCLMRLRSPSLNVLVDKETNIRKKRQLLHNQARRTDCYPGAKKRRCCRHTMEVVFKELPGYEFVLQPYGFDAGYCKGPCPYRYNPANHHSSLQSLIWKQKKVGAKPCCAPSKLDKLEILHLDEHDNTKLKVASWSNMMVLECACF